MKKLKKVLIANRGEIAVRIIRTLREMGIQSVAIYSEADKYSAHRKLADYSFMLKGRSSAETYLNTDLIKEVISQSGADGVHPGYGFLSENADFAQLVQDCGVTFIGPDVSAIRQMGDKITARKLMRAAGVEVVPGSDEPLSKWEDIKNLATEIGYPLIIKAAAGGGGRGMRVVRTDQELKPAFDACTREALDYFSNPAIFCERYIENSKHIEFQVLFDQHGKGVHLFERDCSVQRRHQKLLEEAPSSFLNDELRAKLGAVAVKAGEAVNYSGAGTVELICESHDRCYFMEMNTRIQVEHPVTEMITGVDLIAEQIKVANGEHLSFKQEDIKLNGWAFETRINAEEPFKEFLPNPGLVKKLKLPQGPFVRVDTHLYEGYTIPSEYDSMIAKIITWGVDRNAAIARMKRALSELEVEGVPTTTRFHEAVFNDADFISGNFDTSYIEKKYDSIMKKAKAPLGSNTDVVAAFAAVMNLCSIQSNLSTSKSSLRSEWKKKAKMEARGDL